MSYFYSEDFYLSNYAINLLINIYLRLDFTIKNPHVGSSILSLATINFNILRIVFVHWVIYSCSICVSFVPKINIEPYLKLPKSLI